MLESAEILDAVVQEVLTMIDFNVVGKNFELNTRV